MNWVVLAPNWSLSSVVELGDVLCDGRLHSGVVSSINLILLLSFGEDEEAGFASQGAVLKTADKFLGEVLFAAAEEFHAHEVLIEPHEQGSVVLLHVVAATAPVQVNVDTYADSLVSDRAIYLQTSFLFSILIFS